MALEIIGAGFGRTGTMSLKGALEQLGFGPCHHMLEVISRDDQRAMWGEVGDGAAPDFDALFDGYRSQVDWPGAAYWRELARHYPDAKVILTLRDADSWHRSVMNTIGKYMMPPEDPDASGPAAIGYPIINKPIFDGRVLEPDHAKAVFEAHNREVRETIPADRLLVLEVGAGWEPLCDFLGVDVPEEPYPSRNSTLEFRTRVPES